MDYQVIEARKEILTTKNAKNTKGRDRENHFLSRPFAFFAVVVIISAFAAAGCSMRGARGLESAAFHSLTPVVPKFISSTAAASADAATSPSRELALWTRAQDAPRRWTADPANEQMPDVAPDGRLLAYVSDAEGSEDILLLPLPPAAPDPPRRFAASPARELSPRFSPDGRRIAYISTLDDAFGDLWVAPVSAKRSGAARKLTDRSTRDADPAWTPGGRSIVFSRAEGEKPPALAIYDLKTGSTRDLASGPASQPDVSPDGRWVVHAVPGANGISTSLALFDLQNEMGHPALVADYPMANPRFAPDGRAVLFAAGSDDTSTDDRFSPEDNWVIWRAEFDPASGDLRTPAPLTSAASDSRQPAPFKGGFFFARNSRLRRGDLFTFGEMGAVNLAEGLTDASAAPDASAIPDSSAAPKSSAALARVLRLAADRPNEPDLILCAWRNLAALAQEEINLGRDVQATGKSHNSQLTTPNSSLTTHNSQPTTLPDISSRARIAEIRLLIQIGRLQQARRVAGRLASDADAPGAYRGLASVELQRALVAQSERATAKPETLAESRRQALAAIQALLADPAYSGQAEFAAEARLFAAQLHRDLGDPRAAIEETDAILLNYPDQPSARARALLLRGALQERLGLNDEVVPTYLGVVRDFPGQRRECIEAARRVVDAAASEGKTPDDKRRLLRVQIAAPQTPALVSAFAQNRIGDLFAAEERFGDAIEEYGRTIARYSQETEAVSAAHFALSRIYYDLGNYAESVRAYERIELRLRPRDDAFHARARRGYIRQTLLKAEAEWRQNDPLQARATFASLLDYDAEIVEAWRGILRSDNALGRIPATLREIETSLSAAPDRPALRYARGLALSYLPGRESESIRELQRAALLDPGSPYPHQTLGYLFEQRMNTRNDTAAGERSLREYQLALTLSDAELVPQNVAALIVNCGNSARLLGLWGLAHSYYQQRLKSTEPHEDPRTEFLFLRRAAEVAFSAGDSFGAAGLYARAREALPAARAKDKNNQAGNWDDQERELIDRRALALQEAGQNDEAARLFADVAARAERAKNPRAAALARRNYGVNLFLAARSLRGPERTAQLRTAWEAFDSSRQTVEREGAISVKERNKKRGGGGLFSIAAVVGLGGADSTASGLGFDERGELRLLTAFQGWIAEADDNPEAALASLRAQLDSYPKLTDANRVFILSQKAVLFSRAAALEERRGRLAEAARATLDSLDACRWTLAKEEFYNARGAVVAALNLARLWTVVPEAIPPEARSNWLALRTQKPKDAKEWTEKDAIPFASTEEAILATLAGARGLLAGDPPPPAAVLLPEVSFHEAALRLRQADDLLAAPLDPARPMQAIEDTARALELARSARAGFADAERVCAAQTAAEKTTFAISAEDRLRQRRIQIAAQLQQAQALRLLGRAADADAAASRGLSLAAAWGYQDLVFAYEFESGWRAADSPNASDAPGARLAHWHRAAEAAESALPGQRDSSAMARAARATIGSALARDAARAGQWEKAWRWSEWAQAQNLASEIDELAPDLAGESASKLAPKLRALVDDIRALLDRQRRLAVATDPAPEALAGEMASLRARWTELLDAARGEDPAAWSLFSGQPLELGDVIDLLPPETALVRMAWCGDGVLLLQTAGGEFSGRFIEDLDGRLAAIIERAASGESIESGANAASDLEFLSKTLLSPLSGILGPAGEGAEKKDRVLLLSTDAALLALPIEALPAPGATGDAPGQRVAISRVASIAHLYLCETRKSPWRQRLLTFGTPQASSPSAAATPVPASAITGYYAATASVEGPLSAPDALAAGRQADLIRVAWPLALDPLRPAATRLDTAPAPATVGGNPPGATVSVRDLFASGWSASCAAFERPAFTAAAPATGNQASLDLFLMALAWGGCPSVVLGPPVMDKSDRSDQSDKSAEFDFAVWSGFWKALASESPAAALRQARAEAAQTADKNLGRDVQATGKKLGQDVQATGNAARAAQFRLWGHPGLSREAARAFAEEQLEERIQRARVAFQAKNWSAAAAGFSRVVALLDLMNPDDDRLPDAAQLQADAADQAGDSALSVQGAARYVAEIERRAQADPPILPPARLAAALRYAAGIYDHARLHDRAADTMRREIEIRRPLDDPAELLASLVKLGVVLENGARYEDALAAYDKARAMCAELEVPEEEAAQWRRIGRIRLLFLGQWLSAEDAFTRARDLYQAAAESRGLTESLLDLALTAERRADFDQALDYYARAEESAKGLGDESLLARAALGQAETHWLTGNYLEAIRRQQAALEHARAGQNAAIELAAHNTAGLTRWMLNDHERALAEFDQALALSRRLGLLDEESSTLNNTGLVWRSRAEYPKALEYFNSALEIDRAHGLEWGEAYDHRNIGMTHLLAGNLDAALEQLQQAAAMAQRLGDRVNYAKAILSLADTERRLERPADARAHYDETLAESRSRNLPEVEWRALQGLATLARQSGDRPEAIRILGQAIEVVERMRASIRVEELQDGFLADKQGLYEEMILLLLDEAKPREAFEFNERARGRSFIDLLGNQRLDVGRPEDAQLLERDRTTRAELDRLKVRLAAATDDATRKEIQGRVEALNAELADLLLKIRLQNPALSAFVTVEPLNLEELFKLLGSDVALVEYFLAEKETIVWIVRDGHLDVVRIPENRAKLTEDVTNYRRRIQAIEDVSELSLDLHRRLIAPIEPYLAGAPRLAIVPHAALHYCSFASLSDGRTNLIDRYPIFYLPSASVYRYTEARRKDTKNLRVLAIGNPDLGNPNLDLPFAQKEAERLVWSFPEVTVLTGERATRSWVEENASQYGVIHLASHGEFESLNPLYSALLLAPDKEYSDGRLTVRDIFRLTINADLVTLSACESGLARVNTGDDLVGLNRAFIYAGTHSIVTSLWRVDDIATAVMVKHFYRNYADVDKAEALRRAQAQVRRLQPHPAYWSGLILTGDWK